MNKFFSTLMICFFALCTFSCKDDQGDTDLYLDLYLDELTFGQDAETRYATVLTNRAFTATVPAAWCQVQPVEGKWGEMDNLLVSVDRNDALDSRQTEITVVAGGSVRTITVRQGGFEPILEATQSGVSVSETGTGFELEITSNILFTFELPEWIHHSGENTPIAGTKTYTFTVTPFEGVRVGNVVMKSADSRTNISVSVPVKQGDPTLVLLSRNKGRFEALNSIEGYSPATELAWWNPNFVSEAKFTYRVYVAEDGVYDFQFFGTTWSLYAKVHLYVDDIHVAEMADYFVFPDNTDYSEEANSYSINGASLTEGIHTIIFRIDIGVLSCVYFTGVRVGDYVEPPDNSPVISKATSCKIDAYTSTEAYSTGKSANFDSRLFDNQRVVTVEDVEINEEGKYVFTFPVRVEDAGDYRFVLRYATWCRWENCLGGSDIVLFVDDEQRGHTGTLTNIDDFLYLAVAPESDIVEDIDLTAGKHTLRFEINISSFVFGWFTVTAK